MVTVALYRPRNESLDFTCPMCGPTEWKGLFARAGMRVSACALCRCACVHVRVLARARACNLTYMKELRNPFTIFQPALSAHKHFGGLLFWYAMCFTQFLSIPTGRFVSFIQQPSWFSNLGLPTGLMLIQSRGHWIIKYHKISSCSVFAKPFDNKPSHSTCCHLAIGLGTKILPIQ